MGVMTVAIAKAVVIGHHLLRPHGPLKGEAPMKFNIEIDSTPEEVRRLMGLPDLTDVHAVYLDRVKDTMAKGITPDMVESMVRTWVPMGGAGVDFVKDMIGGLATASKGKKN
jgi:Family of unknown function (DUF6489)